MIHFLLLGFLVSIFCYFAPTFADDVKPYMVVKSEGKFEIRNYPALMSLELVTENDFLESQKLNSKFEDYFKGKNSKKLKSEQSGSIFFQETTLPALLRIGADSKPKEAWKLFVLFPESATLDSLGRPEDEALNLKVQSQRKMASLQFSGSSSLADFKDQEKKLKDWLDKQSVKTKGSAIFTQLKSGFWFNQTSEVLLELDN